MNHTDVLLSPSTMWIVRSRGIPSSGVARSTGVAKQIRLQGSSIQSLAASMISCSRSRKTGLYEISMQSLRAGQISGSLEGVTCDGIGDGHSGGGSGVHAAASAAKTKRTTIKLLPT